MYLLHILHKILLFLICSRNNSWLYSSDVARFCIKKHGFSSMDDMYVYLYKYIHAYIYIYIHYIILCSLPSFDKHLYGYIEFAYCFFKSFTLYCPTRIYSCRYRKETFIYVLCMRFLEIRQRIYIA